MTSSNWLSSKRFYIAAQPVAWASLVLLAGWGPCDGDDFPGGPSSNAATTGGTGATGGVASTGGAAGAGGLGTGGDGTGGSGGATTSAGGAGGSGGGGGGGGVPAPAVGDVVITEVMLAPTVAVIPSVARYVELTNVSASAVDIGDCELWTPTTHTFSAPTVLAPNDPYVIAGSDPGFIADETYVSLSIFPNVGVIELRCGLSSTPYVVDSAVWDTSNGTFPNTGVALEVDPANLTASANDTNASWCASTNRYATNGTASDFGTPGADNTPCVLPAAVTECRLFAPLDGFFDVTSGVAVTMEAAITVDGYTTVNAMANELAHPLLVLHHIHGTDPDPATWTQGNAMVPSGSWPAGLNAGEDHYTSSTTVGLSEFRSGIRASADGGDTSVVCDTNGLPFAIDDAGYLTGVNPFLHFGEIAILTAGSEQFIELFNPRPTSSSMSTCQLHIYLDGVADYTIDLPNVSVPAGGAYTICTFGSTCDFPTSSLSFDGNDTILLECGGNGAVFDAIGQIGVATTWTAEEVVLVRDCIPGGDADPTNPFDITRHWTKVEMGGVPDPSGLGTPSCP